VAGRQDDSAARPLRIGISGGGDDADTRALEIAGRLGSLLARAGAVVVCGGLGGVMRAAAEGARDAGGLTIGILPGACAGDADPSIVIPVVTDLGHARNVVLVHTSEALVAVRGSYGTLSEIALALKIGVPVAAVDSFDAGRVGHPPPPIVRCVGAEDAAAWALDAARARRAATAGRRGPGEQAAPGEAPG
jgi:uncharacterized protein (TIGR00725 family)